MAKTSFMLRTLFLLGVIAPVRLCAQEASVPDGTALEEKVSATDAIVVPAGTEIKVDVDQHKTIVPVRVGFTTAIPALSQVTVNVNRLYVNVPISYQGPEVSSYTDYEDNATLTAITVAGKNYEVQARPIRLSKGGTNNEVTFVLDAPLSILR